MAAIANALCNATGVQITKLPLSPENGLRGLKESGKA
jgi:CO/xanthine dehydrogenase Mo-binding subunit